MKKFSLRNVSLLFSLTLLVSLFASNESYAQYVSKAAAVNILTTEVNTLAQNVSTLNDVDMNTLYLMKIVAEDIHDNNTDVASALDRGMHSIGFKDQSTGSASSIDAGFSKMTDLPGLSTTQYLAIKQDVAELLQ